MTTFASAGAGCSEHGAIRLARQEELIQAVCQWVYEDDPTFGVPGNPLAKCFSKRCPLPPTHIYGSRTRCVTYCTAHAETLARRRRADAIAEKLREERKIVRRGHLPTFPQGTRCWRVVQAVRARPKATRRELAEMAGVSLAIVDYALSEKRQGLVPWRKRRRLLTAR